MTAVGCLACVQKNSCWQPPKARHQLSSTVDGQLEISKQTALHGQLRRQCTAFNDAGIACVKPQISLQLSMMQMLVFAWRGAPLGQVAGPGKQSDGRALCRPRGLHLGTHQAWSQALPCLLLDNSSLVRLLLGAKGSGGVHCMCS